MIFLRNSTRGNNNILRFSDLIPERESLVEETRKKIERIFDIKTRRQLFSGLINFNWLNLLNIGDKGRDNSMEKITTELPCGYILRSTPLDTTIQLITARKSFCTCNYHTVSHTLISDRRKISFSGGGAEEGGPLVRSINGRVAKGCGQSEQRRIGWQ